MIGGVKVKCLKTWILGFDALNEDSKKMTYKGKAYPAELGTILWAHTSNMERRK